MDWPVAIASGWHPVALQSELGSKPLGCMLMGRRLVLFRSGNGLGLLHDRCPHRGVPLSRGWIEANTIVCPYHGFRFAIDGACVAVPGSDVCADLRAPALPVRVAAGLVWTTLAVEPGPFPVLPPTFDDPAMDRFWWRLAPSRAGVLDALENHLDPSHPHFVHPWLVRAPSRRRSVRVEVRSGPWGAEAIYFEQRRNQALLPAFMEGQRANGVGRLWPPTIGEVRLESAAGAMLSITVVFAPVDRDLTRPYAHLASSRGLLPAWFKRLALKAFHFPVLFQDRKLLALQAANRSGEGYGRGPLDVLSGEIWRHANGEVCPEASRTMQMEL